MWKLETGNREPGITMRILITGITGFVGGHLVEFLRAEGGHELFGISRKGTWPTELAHLSGSAQLFTAELLDTNAIAAAIRAAQPEWVFHLAGFAHAGKSFQEPDRCWNDNLTGTRVLYDTIARSAFRPRILFVSSGLIYGDLDNPSVACDASEVCTGTTVDCPPDGALPVGTACTLPVPAPRFHGSLISPFSNFSVCAAIRPPLRLAMKLEMNQMPMRSETKRTGAALVTYDRPVGERQSSPMVCRK